MTQPEALAILESGQSALLTGAAGSGKTYLLNRFVRRAKAAGRSVAVTATTGLAATHLGGSTIHAWSGIGIGDQLTAGQVRGLSPQRRQTIERADVLVIDEVSMLHDFRLDMVETVCRQVRDRDLPFGGLQVILCGDFFQLPPINRPDGRSGGFVTTATAWQRHDWAVLYLDEQHRQRDDDGFAALLNALRSDRLERSQVERLQSRIGIDPAGAVTPTGLYTTNVDVDAINQDHLDQLAAEEHRYQLSSSGGARYVETLKRSCLAPELLRLKLGALVMFIKNAQDRKYVNGSLGVVTGFEEETDYPIVTLAQSDRRVVARPESWELRDGETRRAQLTQLPLRLAWAITVHKSQGMTLDAAVIDLRRAFAPGMGYVALSRVRRLEDLTLRGLGAMALRVSPEALAIDVQLRTASQQLLATSADILAGAEERWEQPDQVEPEAVVAPGGWADRLAKMRQVYPNAYRPWSQADDAKLKSLYDGGSGLAALTTAFGRHPGSIRSRIKKHYGEAAMVSGD